MTDSPNDPSWLPRLGRLVVRLGPWRATALLTALILAATVSLAAALVALGGGDVGLAVAVAAACVLLTAPVAGGVIVHLAYRLELARRRLAVAATCDELTGLPNRRHFTTEAARVWAQCRRYDTDAALLLVDVDDFKAINDSHGHAAGDNVLREIARVVSQALRQADLPARFGGDELVVFLPHTDPLGALDVAERIRVHVGDLRVDWQGEPLKVTVSVGVAAANHTHATLDALMHDADVALYAAKQAGRNCVRCAPAPYGRAPADSSVGDRRPAGPV